MKAGMQQCVPALLFSGSKFNGLNLASGNALFTY